MRSFLLAIAVLTAACGPDGTSWTGIYAIDAWNENPTGCADPGPSVLGTRTETHFYIENDTFFTQAVVVAELCASVEECRTLQPQDVPLFTAFGLYDQGSDDGGWRSRGGSVSPMDTTCVGTQVLMLMDEDDTGIHLRQELTDVTYPASSDPDDRCPFDALYEAAAAAPCTSLEIVHGTFVQDF